MSKLRGQYPLNESKDYFPGVFAIKAHCSYRVAAHLVLNTQLYEAYMVLRGCLEAALYRFHFWRNPDKASIWFERHHDDESLRKVRREFQIRTLIDDFRSHDQKTGQAFDTLYNRTIDYGAHPNVYALMTSLNLKSEAKTHTFEVKYFNSDRIPMDLALKTTPQVGLTVLRVFENIFSTRFELLGINKEVEKLCRRF